MVSRCPTKLLVGAFVESFQTQPYSTLADAVFLAGVFTRRASEVFGYDQYIADDLQVQAARIEYIACGLIRVLGKTSQSFLSTFLESDAATAAIRDAVHNNCKVLVNLPEVQDQIHKRFDHGKRNLARLFTSGGIELYGASLMLSRLLSPLFNGMIWLAMAVYPPLISSASCKRR